MAYNVVPTVITGDGWSAGNNNTYVRDNFKASVPDVFTAVGDMVVGTLDNAMSVLPIGTADQYLTVSTSGEVDWVGPQYPSLSTLVGSFSYPNIPKNNWYVIPFVFDYFDYDGLDLALIAGSNSRMYVPYDGVYQISGTFAWLGTDTAAGGYYANSVGASGLVVSQMRSFGTASRWTAMPFCHIARYITTDQIQFKGYRTAGGTGVAAQVWAVCVRYLGAST